MLGRVAVPHYVQEVCTVPLVEATAEGVKEGRYERTRRGGRRMGWGWEWYGEAKDIFRGNMVRKKKVHEKNKSHLTYPNN